LTAFRQNTEIHAAQANRFQLYSTANSWAAHQRIGERMTRDEHALWSELWTLRIGKELPTAKRYLAIRHWTPEETAAARSKPALLWKQQ
jgi:hypothetical protein